MKLVKTALWFSLILAANTVCAQQYDIRLTSSSFQGSAVNDGSVIGGSMLVSMGPNVRGYAAYENPIIGYSLIVDRSPSSLSSRIEDINELGISVGSKDEISSSRSNGQVPMLFRSSGREVRLGHLPGNFISEAKGINNLLWVVGTSGSEYASTNYERYDKPFLWVPHAGTLESGTMQELPCDRDSNDDGILDISVCPSAIRGSANAINDAGLIGGKLGGKPYLWWNGQGYDISSWLPPLIDLGGGYYASNTDLIACEVTSVSNSYAYTIVCPGAFNFELGQSVGISFISTPSVPGFTRVDARLNAVNDEGCAVGTVIPRVGATMTAVKYCNGTLTDLNTTTVSKSGRLAEALDINNRGQILVKINDRPRPAPQNQITALLVPRP